MPRYYRRRGTMFRNLVKRYLTGFGLIFLGILIAIACSYSYLFQGNNAALLPCYAFSLVVGLIEAAMVTGFRL
jgi:ACR3 family arsenite efflux pump ArsB